MQSTSSHFFRIELFLFNNSDMRKELILGSKVCLTAYGTTIGRTGPISKALNYFGVIQGKWKIVTEV